MGNEALGIARLGNQDIPETGEKSGSARRREEDHSSLSNSGGDVDNCC